RTRRPTRPSWRRAWSGCLALRETPSSIRFSAPAQPRRPQASAAATASASRWTLSISGTLRRASPPLWTRSLPARPSPWRVPELEPARFAGSVGGAVADFWRTRRKQAAALGGIAGVRDAGERASVTGGAQMDGFVNLIRDLLCERGASRQSVHCESRLELPGWYRPEKKWDLILVSKGSLLAGIEFKSQCGPSFGNNYNNRTEEALGSATDLWAAYREGAFKPSARPWLGYL